MFSVDKWLKLLRPIIPHLPKAAQRLMPRVLAFLPVAFEIANLLYKHCGKIKEILGNLAGGVSTESRKETDGLSETIPRLPRGRGRWLKRRLAYLPLALEIAKASNRKNMKRLQNFTAPLPGNVKRSKKMFDFSRGLAFGFLISVAIALLFVGCGETHDTVVMDPATYEYNEAVEAMQNAATAPSLGIQKVAENFLIAAEVDAVWVNDEDSDFVYTTLFIDVEMGDVVAEDDWETSMSLFITHRDDPDSPLRRLKPGDIAQVVFSVRGFWVESSVSKWGNTSSLNIRCDFIELLE